MRVVLRHSGIGLYYAGGVGLIGMWKAFEEMEIFVTFDDPFCEMVLPLARKIARADDTLRTAA